jgi:hypothetical protein
MPACSIVIGALACGCEGLPAARVPRGGRRLRILGTVIGMPFRSLGHDEAERLAGPADPGLDGALRDPDHGRRLQVVMPWAPTSISASR